MDTLSFSLRIAGRVFAIDAEFGSLPSKYDLWLAEEGATPDYRIYISAADIQAQGSRAKPKSTHTATLDFLATGVDWPFSFLVQDRIARALLREDVLYMHASSLLYQGHAFVFSAPSGIGKSTHARLWCETFGDEVTMINDDKVFLRLNDEGGVTVYGTPWRGKHEIGDNIEAPLGGICFLSQANENHIRRLRKEEAYYHLYHQIYIWQDAEATGDAQLVFPLIGKLADRVPLWFLSCNKDPEAARLSCETMVGAL